jgi:hypothetical protein
VLLPALSLLVLFLAVHLYHTPRAVLQRYVATFRARHGVNLPISLAVLAASCLSGVIASVVHPGHPLAEAVIGLVLAALTLAGLVDLRRFRRR